jgi:preprotein translocase subunit SecE
VTDFRGEPLPKKENVGLFLQGRATSTYLGRDFEKRGGSRFFCVRCNRRIGTAMARVSPFKFLQEVRSEVSKVTWPNRKETTLTTTMVFIMVVLASIFFLLVDVVLSKLVSLILGFGG